MSLTLTSPAFADGEMIPVQSGFNPAFDNSYLISNYIKLAGDDVSGAPLVSGVQDYDVQQSIDGDAWVVILSDETGTLEYIDVTGAPEGTIYSFRCRAQDRAGNQGDWSEEKSTMIDVADPD